MKYKTFLFTFLASVLAGVVFFIFYIRAIFSLTRYASGNYEPDPGRVLEMIFTPGVIISLIIAILASLAYRIMAIVWVSKNKTISGNEKALWIIGFILLGFVTAIVFLILAKSRRLIEDESTVTYSS